MKKAENKRMRERTMEKRWWEKMTKEERNEGKKKLKNEVWGE